MKNYFVWNFDFAQRGAEVPFCWKIENFMKSQNFDGFFPKFNPNPLKFTTAKRLQTLFEKFKSS